MRWIQRRSRYKKSLGKGVVDGPRYAPFNINFLDEGPALRENGRGKVAEAVEVGEGEGIG
jgi:hypothetical protein